MKRVVIMIFILSLYLFSDNTSFSVDDKGQQREIYTKKDFTELEKVLLSTVQVDSMKAYYYLGLLYITEHHLDNNKTIKPDYTKAIAYLEASLNKGNILAAHTISMYHLKHKKIDDAIFVLDMALKFHKIDDENSKASGAYISSSLASIVMEFKSNNKEAVSLAIFYLKKYVELRDIPSADYLLSQLYFSLSDYNNANKFLTRSCKNIKVPDEIKAICKELKATN